MNCREARRCLSPYLDSELDPTTTFAISEHLRVCEECRRRFEAERDVDRNVVAALDAGNMPDEMWQDIVRPVQRPSWRRWLAYAPLAAAVVFAMVVWAAWPRRPAGSQPHWVVQEFLAATNYGHPFAASDGITMPSGKTLRLNPFANLVMSLAGEDAMKHVVQLVRIDTVREPDGAESVEVRLNCCGEPVIVRAARRDRAGRLREFIGADEERLAMLPSTDNITVAEREVGDYVVVAVSRHPMTHLLTAMEVQ